MKISTTFLRTSIFSILLFFTSLLVNGQAPPSNLSGEALRTWLKQNYYDDKHVELGYSTARMYMYNYIDNHNNTITGVYSGYEVSWTYGGTGTNPAPINCEHTVPQSFFGKAEPMRSDIHHLFPTYQNWNSTRSNYPFTDINDNTTVKWMYLDQEQATIPTSNIDLYSEYANSTFEPREDHKGDCARAIFYFYTMYPTQAGDISSVADINTLYQWHLNDPVDAKEIARNNAIETYQGDRNPYIDYPDAVAEAWGFTSTPSVPAPPSLSLVASASNLTISWNDLSNENGYKIYRSVNGSTFTQLVDLAANTTSYQDNNVVESSIYEYYAIAYNTIGNSSNSNIVSGQLQTGGGTGNGVATDLFISEYIEGSSYNKALEIANFTGAPVNLSAYSIFKQTNGAGSWSSELALSGTLNNGEVYVIVNSNAGATLTAQADLTTTSAALTFNGNDPVALFKSGSLVDMIGTFNSSATYAQDVTMVRNSSVSSPNATYTTSEWTNYAQDEFSYIGAHTFDGGTTTDTEAPTVPALLASSNITETSFTLSWSASTDNIAVEGYEIYKDGSLTGTTTSTYYNLSGLSALTSYSMTVKAKDAAGNVSAASSTLVVQTNDDTAPTVPTSLASTNITESSFTLSWSASTDNVAVTGYDVYKDGSFLATTTGTSYNVTGLTQNTTYAMAVLAKDDSENNSALSSSLNVTTNAVGTGGPDLFISEYIEGSSYNKALEIVNLTGSTVDLSNYSLFKQTNGAGAWGSELALSGTLANGEVYVIANSGASATILAQADLSTSSNAMTFNGNDPVALFKSGTLIDVVGTFNSTANYGQDVTMVRNLAVTEPNTTYDVNEWTVYGVDEFSYLGSYGTTTPTTVELVNTDFESGWDVWTDGGSDCKLYSSGTYVSNGWYSADIQDNSGASSSFYLTNGIDLNTDGYTSLTINFNFIPISMEAGEDFYVEFYDGAGWNVVANYVKGTDFDNNYIYSATITIDEANYNFAANSNIRFRCDASGNADDIYIDEIVITGSTSSAKTRFIAGNTIAKTGKSVEQQFDAKEVNLNVYPVPMVTTATIELKSDENLEQTSISIFDMQGRVIYTTNQLINANNYKVELNVSDWKPDIYLMKVDAKEFSLQKKLIIN